MTAYPLPLPPLVELRYRFEGDMFVHESTGQLHEDDVHGIDGAVVVFSYSYLESEAADAREAANQIAAWLLEDCDALVVQVVPIEGP